MATIPTEKEVMSKILAHPEIIAQMISDPSNSSVMLGELLGIPEEEIPKDGEQTFNKQVGMISELLTTTTKALTKELSNKRPHEKFLYKDLYYWLGSRADLKVFKAYETQYQDFAKQMSAIDSKCTITYDLESRLSIVRKFIDLEMQFQDEIISCYPNLKFLPSTDDTIYTPYKPRVVKPVIKSDYTLPDMRHVPPEFMYLFAKGTCPDKHLSQKDLGYWCNSKMFSDILKDVYKLYNDYVLKTIAIEEYRSTCSVDYDSDARHKLFQDLIDLETRFQKSILANYPNLDKDTYAYIKM